MVNKLNLSGVGIALLALAVSFSALASSKDCEESLKSEGNSSKIFEVIPSDRVPSEAEKYREYVRELTEPGGVIDRLGIRMTGQIVEFVQGRDLNALTSGTAGGNPVSFYLDGAAVLRSLEPKNSFALEVVYPGPAYQHGYYRDDNPFAQQISIIDHVVGHNNFAYISGLPHYRAGQGILATKRLDRLLRELYINYNKDEVQRYYLWSLTLARLMDWYTPYFQTSKEFEPQFEVAWDPLGRSKPTVKRHPKSPTENVMAAFAGNIAPHEPQWKREILEYLQVSMAFRPALVHTQIMNEGWASIMQEIIPKHTKNNHSLDYWMSASRVMQAEAAPQLHDPYSLGVFCWRHLRNRFEKRPEIKALPNQEAKDRAFIQYANDEIISHMDDSQFLRLAMDQAFVDKYKLAAVRRATDSEVDPNMPPPPPKPGQPPPAQWIVASRDADRVVHGVIDQVLKPKYYFNPRLKLIDFNRPGSGEVELVLDDPVGLNLAIEQSSVGPALYAIANIIGKPVSLETNLALPKGSDLVGPLRRGPPKKEFALQPVRIVVSPSGELRIHTQKPLSEEQIEDLPFKRPQREESYSEDLTERLAPYLRAYIQDLYLHDREDLENVVNASQTLRGEMRKAVAAAIDDSPYDSLIAHAPNVPGALTEYQSMVERRLLAAMELAAQGKQQIRMVGQKLRIKALPSEVHFGFDPEYLNSIAAEAPPMPVDRVNMLQKEEPSHLRSVLGDLQGNDGRITGGLDGKPGDRFWGPGQPPPGGGSGNKPGEDPEDISWVEIPQDLYSKFLGERVKLPKLNKKPGMSRTKKMKAGRRANRLSGEPLPTNIAINAYLRGAGVAIADGRDPGDDIEQTFDDGFAALLPRDWVVKGQVVTKKPDVKAVVTFVLDASASTAAYKEAFKRFVFDIKTLIQANYKGFAFRFITFDGQAHVLESEEAFFRSELGGGTRYETGLVKARELFEAEYPRASWDRFTFLMGDMEDFDVGRSGPALDELVEQTEFFGAVAGLNSGRNSPFLEFLDWVESKRDESDQVGVTILGEDGSYGIENIREVLRNTEDE